MEKQTKKQIEKKKIEEWNKLSYDEKVKFNGFAGFCCPKTNDNYIFQNGSKLTKLKRTIV